MNYAARNLLTLATILMAFAAFAAELAGVVPAGKGIDLAEVSVVAIAAARGIVTAVEVLKREPNA